MASLLWRRRLAMMYIQPLISIITPSYNQERFLKYTLTCVERQDYPHLEHIIIDGKSTDGSVELIREYADRHPKQVSWVSEKDAGQADAINKGFRMAHGEILAWINSDDCYLFTDILSKVSQVFSEHPDMDILYGDVAIVDSNNRVLRIQHTPNFNPSRLMRKCFIAQPAVFFRKNVFENEQLDTNISVALDYEYWLRLAGKFEFMHVPQLWAIDRSQPGRKILVMREQLDKENNEIRTRFREIHRGVFWLDFLYKLCFGIFSRLTGLLTMISLRVEKPEKLAIPLEFDMLFESMQRQLFGRNKNT